MEIYNHSLKDELENVEADIERIRKSRLSNKNVIEESSFQDAESQDYRSYRKERQ